MLSKKPIDLNKANKEDTDKAALRTAIIAELDAINLYEQLAATVKDKDVKKVLLDIAKEEKVHFGEFQTMLFRLDEEHVQGVQKGKKEVEELTKK